MRKQVTENTENKCEGCPLSNLYKKEALRKNDSVFEAAKELDELIEKCKRKSKC